MNLYQLTYDRVATLSVNRTFKVLVVARDLQLANELVHTLYHKPLYILGAQPASTEWLGGIVVPSSIPGKVNHDGPTPVIIQPATE